IPGPEHLAAGAYPGEDQGVLCRFRSVPVAARQLAQCGRHQLRNAAPAGSLEAAKRIGEPDATVTANCRKSTPDTVTQLPLWPSVDRLSTLRKNVPGTIRASRLFGG